MDDKIIGNIIELDHLDGNISQIDHLSGNLNSSGDEQTVYRGYSAYEVALQQGFEGSKDEWLRALVGPQGETGVSISDVRLNDDFTLTITLDDGTEFTTEPIKGDKGDKGQKGDKGDKGDTGKGISFVRLNDDYTLTVIFSDGSDYKTHIPIRGEKGQQGIQGIQGPKGDTGERGPQGQQGIQGVQGPKGQTGQTGPQGIQGPQGQKGQKGDTGEKGEKGQTGPQGEPGAAFTYEDFTQAQLEGLRGPQGIQGIQGQKGDKGQKGDTGLQGPKGDTGEQGPKGDKGQTGPVGPQGPQGLKGDKGDKGDPGVPGTNMEIHICSITEYDANTRVPTIVNPNSSTFYLVPTEDGTSPDLFTEWVYVNGAWELFGSVKIDLSGYLTDVTVDGNSIVNDGVAEIPIAGSGIKGVVSVINSYGLNVVNGNIAINRATGYDFQNANNKFRPIVTSEQHNSVFYGLAKAAGDTTQSQSSNTVGNYTDSAKDSIQTMLGVSPLIASHESDPFESNHEIGELFIINGKLYKAKTALTVGKYVNEGTNVEVVDVAKVLDDYATKQEIENNINIVEKNSSGSIASFSDGADGIPLKSLVVDINPVQDLSNGDPSPENICPISGWTGANVSATGYNIWDEEWEVGDISSSTGQNEPANTVIRSKNYIPIKPNTEYFFNLTNGGISYVARPRYYDKNKTYIGTGTTVRYNSVFVTPANAYYMRFTPQAPYGTTYNHDISINYPSTDHDYHPYTGRTIPISWETEAGTVYGGKLDVLRGVLRVDKGIYEADGSDDESIALYSGERFEIRNIPNYKSPVASIKDDILCNRLKAIRKGAQGSTIGVISGSDAGSARFMINVGTSTVAETKTWLSENPLTIVYPLATPIEIQLTPHEVNSLLGVNNIFVDTGDSAVEYFSQVDKDLIDYIETSLKPYAKEERLNDYVSDVQIDGSSIITDGVAEIPIADNNNVGTVKINSLYGVNILADGTLQTAEANSAMIKEGSAAYKPIAPRRQHESIFYGLAKAAGDTTQSQSSNAVGTYTDEAKTAIKQMLGIHDTIDSFVEEITGTDVTITGQPSYRYNCGEVLSLSITPPESGTIDIRFTSGSTPTVLTLPSTVKMPEWWVEVEANTIYEMCITDGIYCGVMTWAI